MMGFCIWSVFYLSRHFFSLEYVFLPFIIVEFLYFCLCVSVQYWWRPEEVVASLELALQAAVSCQMWVQGIEFLFSEKKKKQQVFLTAEASLQS